MLLSFLSIVLHILIDYLPSFLSSRIQAALFLITLIAPKSVPSRVGAVSYWINNYNAKVYSSRPVSRKTRTILLVHGNAPSGANDFRVVNLARALASANPNHLVVVPHIAPFARMEIRYDPMIQIIQDVSRDKCLSPSGTVSIAGPCIPSGLSLIASTFVNVVDSFLCVGAHANFHACVRHCIKTCEREDSRYAINAMFSTFLYPHDERVKAMCRAFCDDDHYQNIGKQSNILNKLQKDYPEEAKTFNRLQNDMVFLKEVIDTSVDHHKTQLTKLSPIEYVDRLNCKSVVLIHAKKDDVVPPEHCMVLKEAIDKTRKVNTSALVTKLLNHGDQVPLTIAVLPEVLTALNTVSLFFSTISYTR
ncbi:hypothetical protein BWQ96_08888 [Gracilariopsis chorda]|uniref:Uncharacterized protein n=1 Tax=Gracilariopsis chorda TaxID=448386 RepID=A0A2V3IJT7_9FLOR|nr:hypothetical protein BWQ96_08888 [Gracilariopsis chorda]|eukprot:PXF41390.1 hypothetical protein BWQ96_08888 [Gracilariopsis chorda]